MSIDEKRLTEVLAAADHPLGVKEVMRRLELHPGVQTALKRVLRELVRDGRILRDGKRFRPAMDGPGGEAPKLARSAREERAQRPKAPALVWGNDLAARRKRPRGGPPTVVGVLRKRPEGFGFVQRWDADGEDIFVAALEASSWMDGDLLRLEVIPGSLGRTQGRVLELLERRRIEAVGTLRQRGKHAWIEPLDPSLGELVEVVPNEQFHDGDIVRIRLGQPGAKGEPAGKGEVTEVAGKPGEPRLEVLKAAFAQGFSDQFPRSAVDEAERRAIPVEDGQLGGRKDLRNLDLVTIDGADARDFDDAVLVERKGSGYRLVVAIADVSHYVVEGSALDDEALRRATSVYFPGSCFPMLPEVLSNGICSLRPDEDRLCMVADMECDATGAVTGTQLYPAVMRSRARCIYEEVAALLEGGDPGRLAHVAEPLKLAGILGKAMRARRMERGAIDFEIAEARIEVDSESRITGMATRQRNDAHKLIEEFMLAANEAVARHFSKHERPTVYRVHGAPDDKKLVAFVTLAESQGLVVPRAALTPQALNTLLRQIEGTPRQKALNSLLLRAMKQATYTTENIGHYGLATEEYLHFTSPIRRYPDLLVHRLLKREWARQALESGDESGVTKLEAMCRRCSERERAAMKAERDVDALYGCLWVKPRIGERFKATISSIAEVGAFAELDGQHVEGLVRLDSLGEGGKADLVSQVITLGSGKRLALGDTIEVLLRGVDLERRRIDLALWEEGRIAARPQRSLSDAIDELRRHRGVPAGRTPPPGKAGAKGGKPSRGGAGPGRRR